jgi:hypothetical protein
MHSIANLKGDGRMAKKSGSLVFLTRGGVLIPASTGNIQYGIPPETIIIPAYGHKRGAISLLAPVAMITFKNN